jgi:BON domain
MNDEGPLTQARAITEQVRQAFRANEKTAKYPMGVAVQGATVSLQGTVDSQEAKDTAEQLARSVPGVVLVINELVIDENAGQAGGWFGLGRDRDENAGPPIPGAGWLGGIGTGGTTGQGGAVYPGVPLAGATENVPPEEEGGT